MGRVHELIDTHGRQGALCFDLDRSEVETANAYMSDEDNTAINFLYSGWCQTALPHKRLEDSAGWQLETERTTLIVEPGMRPGPAGKPVPVGVPYGSRARLILIYLQSEAVRTRSREVELGGSLRSWLTRLGIPIGGKSITLIRDQAERLARCRMTFEIRKGTSTGLISQNIIDGALFVADDDTGGSRFLEKAQLSTAFFDALKDHSVPLEEAAVRAVSNNSQALDAYAWLAYRLHSLPSPRRVSWAALKVQFGTGVNRQDHFRFKFAPSLRLALAVYPAARVDIDSKGVTLHPSPPPVSKTRLGR